MAEHRTTPADWEHDPLDRFANVDNTTSGFTELRTHGVSGPPPSSLLQFPREVVTLVQGNADSGFWRRWRLGGDREDVPNRHHIEGYCWGGLTSRASLQALWVLLLPFSLVNIAHWMLPPYTGKRGSRLSAWLAVALLRVLALSFTVTLALAGAEITMDLAAWQCGGSAHCRTKLGPWGLIAKLGDRTGPRLAIGGAVLALFLVPLLVAGARRFRPLRDADQAPGPLVKRFIKDEGTGGAAADPVLGDPDFWAVDRSTRWLRCLHAIAWCTVVGAVATGALSVLTVPGDAGHDIGAWLLRANLGALAVVFVAVIPQYFGRGGGGPRSTPGYRWVTTAAVALLGASLAATWAYLPDSAEAGAPALPWVQGAMGRLALAQAVVLVVLAVCVGRLAAGARKDPVPPDGYAPMVGGWLTLVVACLGWTVGLAFSAGLGLWVADRLQGAVNGAGPPGSTVQLISPTLYKWVDVLALLGFVVLVAWVAYVALRVVRQTSAKATRIEKEQTEGPPGPSNQRAGDTSNRCASDNEKVKRARMAARWWILAQSVETIPVMLAWVTAVSLAVAGLAVVAYGRAVGRGDGLFLVDRNTSPSNWYPSTGWLSHLPSLGAWFVTTGTGVLLLVAYGAYRNASTRRIVGILWDVTTFWPRANHPLTPACSAERAVPQLANRIAQLTKDETDALVLSAHSQGSVLGAAAVLRLKQDDGHPGRLPRVALLTYGSPLRRLYARAFPAYFSDQVLEQVREDVGGRWLNLWALTDPIGADIRLSASGPLEDEAADVSTEGEASAFTDLDWRMVPDPLTLDVDVRTGEQVGVCDHSGYLERPEYPMAVELMHVSVVHQTGR